MSVVTLQYQSAAIGDYIFLIIVVLASIIQAISKNRKKAELEKADRDDAGNEAWQDEDNQDRPRREPPKNESPFGSFFDEVEKMIIPEMPKEEPSMDKGYFPETKMKSANATLHSNITEEELNKELEKDNSSLNKKQPVVEKNPVKIKRSLREGFSLKKAVIYSEILNRKYS